MEKLFAGITPAASYKAEGENNPLFTQRFGADPGVMEYNGRVYVYTTNDVIEYDSNGNVAENTYAQVNKINCISSDDMVNWTDHGCPLAQCDFKWADDRSWAPQCIERNGKFYLYVPIHSKISGGMAIGVAVADKVTGPYRDALGKPLYEDGKWDHIDPTVFIDADGQAYLYWGNPRLYSVKLNEDMISLAGEVKCDTTLKRYTEGPWIFHQRQLTKAEKKNRKLFDSSKNSAWGKYFMMYAAGGIPESIAYSESNSPQGPWTYVGDVMAQTNSTNSFTNHSGIVEFKGHNYFFYHTGWLPNGGGFGRSVCCEEFKWNSDGRLPQIKPTYDGVKPIGTLNPYNRVEAETMAWGYGLKSAKMGIKNTGVVADMPTSTGKRNMYIFDIDNDEYIKLRGVDFGKGPKEFAITAAANGKCCVTVRLDSQEGPIAGKVQVTNTGSTEKYKRFKTAVKDATGIHNLFLCFDDVSGEVHLDWWQFK